MALYKQYCEGMFIVAQRYLKDTQAAEDAMQEAFIKAFQKMNQFKGDVTFGAWLKRIVINTCLDTIKSKKADIDPIDESVLEVVNVDDDWKVSDDTTVAEIISLSKHFFFIMKVNIVCVSFYNGYLNMIIFMV